MAERDESFFTLSWRDAALYALSVGCCKQDSLADELRFVYAPRDEAIAVLPTFACTFAFRGVGVGALSVLDSAGLTASSTSLLHVEQRLFLHSPLVLNQQKLRLANSTRLVAASAKTGGTLAVIQTETRTTPGNELVATNIMSVFLRGVHAGSHALPVPAHPAAPLQTPIRTPDTCVEERVAANAALLYRFTGDINPLHVDRHVANAAGFDRPILHGLCTLGIAMRIVIMEMLDGCADSVCSLRCRFASTVIPGDLLTVRAWHLSPGHIVFNAHVAGRTVLAGGEVELRTSAL
jgi:acyl dehydratase